MGLALVRRHELRPAERIDLFCEWLGVTPGGLQFLMDLHRNPRYWHQSLPGRWEFKGWSTVTGPAGPSLGRTGSMEFTATGVLDTRERPSYIVIGKGYPT